MSPFLETWYHQTDCKACGEPLCFLQDPHTGRWAPVESNGNDHRFTCPARNPPPDLAPAAPPAGKPKHKRLALEYEIEHEGQRTLKRWCT